MATTNLYDIIQASLPIGYTGSVGYTGSQSTVIGYTGSQGFSSVVVGSTTVTSGTSTRVLYDNAGVVGEYPITGTGNAVLSDKPQFSTGIGIGQAATTGYSLLIGGSSTGATSTYGSMVQSAIQSDVTTTFYGYRSYPSIAASTTLANLHHYRATQGTIDATSTLTSQIGFYVDNTVTGATTNYGFWGSIPVSGTSNYNLYMAGTAPNYLVGNLVIGSQSYVSTAKIGITGNSTGNTSMYGIMAAPAIQSDVTTAYYNIRSYPSTAAASFTLSNLYHFYAGLNSLGAGSAITAQVGYYVSSGLSSGTSNIGFYGVVPESGTSNYNLYMSGTAPSYFAGGVGIGSASSLSIYKLRVSGTSTDLTGTVSVVRVDGTHTLTANNANIYIGDYVVPIVDQSTFNATRSLGGAGSAVGFFTLPTAIGSSGTVTAIGGFYTYSRNTGAGTVTNGYGFFAAGAYNTGGGTFTNYYGFYSDGSTGATNNYGYYSNLASASGTYNFYAAGTAANYFAGATTFNAAITYGGVTLANSVTGTGSMVLADNPTLTGGGTVTASNPALSITQTWNNAAVTFTGINANYTNTASATGSSIIRLQVGGADVFSITAGGTATLTGAGHLITATGVYGFLNRGRIKSGADGYIDLYNYAQTDFTGLRFGGTTSSFPMIKRNSTAINFRLADDSADAGITAGTATLSGALTYGSVTLTNAVTGTGKMVLDTGPQFTTGIGINAAPGSNVLRVYGNTDTAINTYITGNNTLTSGTGTLVAASTTTTPASSSSAITYGGSFGAYVGATSSTITGTIVGLSASANNNATANNVSNLYGGYFGAYNVSTGTATNLFGVYGRADASSGAGTVTTAYGVQGAVTGSGTITTAVGGQFQVANANATTSYGVLISTISGTTKYGLYQNDSNANNYFAGSVGIGTATLTNTKLRSLYSVTDPSATQTNAYFDGTYTLSAGNNANTYYGVYSVPVIDQGANNATQTLTSGGALRSFYALPSAKGASGTVTAIGGYVADVRNTGAGTLTNGYGFQSAGATNSGGGTFTNYYGFYMGTSTGATNNYGFYTNLAANGSSNFAFYNAGSAPSVFSGPIGLGVIVSPTSGFGMRQSLNATGATSYTGISSRQTIQSDVTTVYQAYATFPATQAASFTLGSLYHYFADQSTIGASSAVTNQYGFYANSSLTGATNNYGFYSNIASASGAYNFYANGTAANYFGGATTFNAAITYGGVALSNSVTGTGSMVLSAAPTLTTSLTLNAQAELRLADSDSSNYVGFKSPAVVTPNVVWTLPSTDGSAGQVLSTNGSATLGWISSSGDFNIGISAAVGYAITNSLATAFTAPSTAGIQYIVRSVHVTNISASDATVTGNLSGTNYSNISFGNTIPVPAGSSVELFKRPKVMNASDLLQLQASANSALHALITYETQTSTKYFGVGVDITADATYTDLYTATGNGVIESILLLNDDGVFDVKTRVVYTDGSNNIVGYLAYDMIIPADSSVELLEAPKYIANGYKIRVYANVGNRLEAVIAGKLA